MKRYVLVQGLHDHLVPEGFVEVRRGGQEPGDVRARGPSGPGSTSPNRPFFSGKGGGRSKARGLPLFFFPPFGWRA